MKTKPNTKSKGKKWKRQRVASKVHIRISIKLLETMIPPGSLFCCCCCFVFVGFALFHAIPYVHNTQSAIVSIEDLDSRSFFEILSSGYHTHTHIHSNANARDKLYLQTCTGKHRWKNWKQTIRKSSEKSKSSAQNAPKTCAKTGNRYFRVFALHCTIFFTHNHIYLL